jgi:hypothetical protein
LGGSGIPTTTAQSRWDGRLVPAALAVDGDDNADDAAAAAFRAVSACIEARTTAAIMRSSTKRVPAMLFANAFRSRMTASSKSD